jgi:hypothetical protein
VGLFFGGGSQVGLPLFLSAEPGAPKDSLSSVLFFFRQVLVFFLRPSAAACELECEAAARERNGCAARRDTA